MNRTVKKQKNTPVPRLLREAQALALYEGRPFLVYLIGMAMLEAGPEQPQRQTEIEVERSNMSGRQTA